MWASVEAVWPTIARHHEGVCAFPYLDTARKVTVGVGSLFDDGTGEPPAAFLGLPWTTVDGRVATRAEVASGWHVVAGRTDLAPKGGHAFRDVTTLRLDAKTIDGLLMARTWEFWSALHSQLVDLDRWPADAQLALLDLAYQLGPWFMDRVRDDGSWVWPNFRAAAHSDDFLRCSQHCSVKQASAERNGHRKRLFANAAQVVEFGIDPGVLWDTKQPEEDTLAINEDRLREIIREELNELLPRIWASDEVDVIPVPTAANPENTHQPASVLRDIRRAVTQPKK